ncbi:hypothetical protein F5B18DRAFT_632823 [Nemania serpens]|nr:hypothetical protein F5B18DRAFT_632823 [Nemania serpens]
MGPHRPLAMPWGVNSAKSGSFPVVFLLAVAPVAYMAYVLRQSARRTTAETRISPPDPLGWKSSSKTRRRRRESLRNAAADADENEEEDEGEEEEEEEEEERDVRTTILPPAVLAAPDEYVVARERVVSEAVPVARIRPSLGLRAGDAEGERGLLETYLGATMRCFAWTPQAFVMRALVSRLPGGAALAETFSTAYLDACRFEVGERVCGVYVVRERVRERVRGERGASRGWEERVLLDLCAPEGWRGPVVSGVLDCGFVVEHREAEEEAEEGEGGGQRVVRFVNETVLWRRRDGRPTLLEGRVSRWMHGLMVRWMVVRGVEAVTGGRGRMNGKET